MPRPSKCSPSFGFLHENSVCNSSVANTCYMPCQPHSFLYHHPNGIWCAGQSIKLLVMHPVTSTILHLNI